jgi:hypothetical protein
MQDALYLDKHLYFMWLAVLLLTTIGVLRRTITIMRGNRISTMVTRTTTIMFALFGVLNKTTSARSKLRALLFKRGVSTFDVTNYFSPK